jgi:hypothetical protein
MRYIRWGFNPPLHRINPKPHDLAPWAASKMLMLPRGGIIADTDSTDTSRVEKTALALDPGQLM